MLMVMTLYMGSWAPPAMSEPRVTQIPWRSISRTGETPLQRLMLDPAQWATTTPARRMAAHSRASEWTQWAMTVWSFHRPNLS